MIDIGAKAMIGMVAGGTDTSETIETENAAAAMTEDLVGLPANRVPATGDTLMLICVVHRLDQKTSKIADWPVRPRIWQHIHQHGKHMQPACACACLQQSALHALSVGSSGCRAGDTLLLVT